MTKLKKIKSAFRNGEKMTHLDALRNFGTNRLAAYVHTLRKEGMNIEPWPKLILVQKILLLGTGRWDRLQE